MELKLIMIVILVIIGILIGTKVAKNILKIGLVGIALIAVYIVFTANENGKSIDFDKIKKITSEVAKTGAKAFNKVEEISSPLFKETK